MGIAPDLLTGFQKLSDKSVLNKFSKKWGADLVSEPGMPVNDMFIEGGKKSPKVLVVVDHDEMIRDAQQIKEADIVIYIGSFENEFIDYADIVLPVATSAETDGSFTNTERRVQFSSKKIEPRYGVLPAWKLYSLIAEAAGNKWNYNSPSDVMKEIAELTPAYSGISHEKLKDKFGIQWPCDNNHKEGTKRLEAGDSGKLKFAVLSGKYKTPSVSPEYPYLLIVGKSHEYWQKNNIMRLTSIPIREYNATLLPYPEGYIEICKENADELKLRDNSRVSIISPYATMETKTMISDRVKPNTVYVPYFINKMITEFLLKHKEFIHSGISEIIPVRILKV
jgi:predicted molibdopterin-dependent oxidoreductase YjgC